MKQTRMKPEARKEEILSAALIIASNSHYTKVTREQIATKAGVSGPAVQYHFKTMTQLRKELMRAAVKQECLPVVAQGYMAKDPFVLRASEDLRRRAIESIGL